MGDTAQEVIGAMCRIFGHDWRCWGSATGRYICRRCETVVADTPKEVDRG